MNIYAQNGQALKSRKASNTRGSITHTEIPFHIRARQQQMKMGETKPKDPVEADTAEVYGGDNAKKMSVTQFYSTMKQKQSGNLFAGDQGQVDVPKPKRGNQEQLLNEENRMSQSLINIQAGHDDIDQSMQKVESVKDEIFCESIGSLKHDRHDYVGIGREPAEDAGQSEVQLTPLGFGEGSAAQAEIKDSLVANGAKI